MSQGKELAILTVGPVCYAAQEAIGRSQQAVTLVDMSLVKPLDEQLLHQICKGHDRLITVEDGVVAGGFGSAILEFMAANGYALPVKCLGVRDRFPSQGPVAELHDIEGYGVAAIHDAILNP